MFKFNMKQKEQVLKNYHGHFYNMNVYNSLKKCVQEIQKMLWYCFNLMENEEIQAAFASVLLFH